MKILFLTLLTASLGIAACYLAGTVLLREYGISGALALAFYVSWRACFVLTKRSLERAARFRSDG